MNWKGSIQRKETEGNRFQPILVLESSNAVLYLWPREQIFVLKHADHEYPFPAKTLEGISRIIDDRFSLPVPPNLEKAWNSIQKFPYVFQETDADQLESEFKELIEKHWKGD